MIQQKHAAKPYHALTIIQKINAKANIIAYGDRYTNGRIKAMSIAMNDLRTHQYDTPFYFSGANPLY